MDWVTYVFSLRSTSSTSLTTPLAKSFSWSYNLDSMDTGKDVNLWAEEKKKKREMIKSGSIWAKNASGANKE